MSSRTSSDQEAAIAAMISGKDVFLTGGAGTGKSHTLDEFTKRRKDLGRSGKVLRTATTGAASSLIKGMTLHSVLGLKSAAHVPHSILKNGRDEKLIKMVEDVDTIAIDEVSMLRVDQVQAIVEKMSIIKSMRGTRPQLIMIGDFAQLPPVTERAEERILNHYYGDKRFAFEHPAWAKFQLCELTMIHRQKGDLTFAKWLSDIRRGLLPDPSFINQFVSSGRHPGAINLVPSHKMANAVNEMERAMIKREDLIFEGKVMGNFPKMNMRTPPILALPPGSTVIICANDPNQSGPREYMNGTTGKLIGKGDEGEAIVLTDDGRTVRVPPFRWENANYMPGEKEEDEWQRKVVGVYHQTPILPGWAITIHRSQGMSLDRVHVDPRNVFAPGQLYVALSRATGTDGLTLESKVTTEMIMHDKKVRAYHSANLNEG